MSYQNRVDPWGNLLTTNQRGTLMGNRGILHNNQKQIIRPYQTRRWIICKLRFKNRHRAIMTPGTYTELFFLDEASALAAGHRPCAECQRNRFNEFKNIWLQANPELGTGSIRIEVLDEILHRERIAGGRKVTYRATLDQLPGGTFFSFEGRAYLIHPAGIFLWSFSGYQPVNRQDFPDEVDVLTPRSIVKAFEHGFIPQIHPSVLEPSRS